jgi:Domain of unknown function (DUF4260)
MYCGGTWGQWALWLLSPDIGMIGYTMGPRVGAVTYNLLHHKAIAVVVGVAGWYFGNDVVLLAALILYAHSSMDRALGYGLKYSDSFQHTHLGLIGKQREGDLPM